MPLVELPLHVGALDAEVGGHEEAAKLRHQLLLGVLRAAEARVAGAVQGGRMPGGVGHLMEEGAREGLVGAEGAARGDEDAVGAGGVTGAPLIAHGFHDGAAGGEDDVVCDGRRAVAHMLRARLGRDALDFGGVEHVPVAHEPEVVPGDLPLPGLLALLRLREGLPAFDEGGLRTLAQTPSRVLYLIEGTPAVVGEAARHADEPEVQAVAAVVHRSGDGIVRREGRKVWFGPSEAVAPHVRDDLLHHGAALFLDPLFH